MKPAAIAAYLLWLAADAFLMNAERHTDDSGIMAGLVLVTAFLLGSLHPRRAWQWALLVGPCIPVSDLIFGSMSLEDGGKLTAFLVVLGMVGAYGGVLLRRTLSAAAAGFHR